MAGTTTTKDILYQISNISGINSYLASLSQSDKDILRNEISKDHEYCKKLRNCIMQYMCTSSILYTDLLVTYLDLLKTQLGLHVSNLWNGLGANEMYWFLEHAPMNLLHELFVDQCFVASCSTNELLALQHKRPELAQFYKTHFIYCPK